jgi:murein L,D-transpeptidase YafK
MAASALLAVVMPLSLSGAGKGHGRESRVVKARENKQAVVEKLFADQGLAYPARQVFIRVFKLEAELEVWVMGPSGSYVKVQTYPICYVPGGLGPKRREGDDQVPEGVYRVNQFNPFSQFHLSLGLDYPNRSDRILGDKARPGGAIFIHGNCVSIGCVPIQDGPIEELYLVCQDSQRKSGLAPVVHIFPCRMDAAACKKELSAAGKGRPELIAFWEDLAKIYAAFQSNHQLPNVQINAQGRYVIK